MAIYCEDCQNYTDQVCENCGQRFGTVKCEIYGCGGRMICEKCRSPNLNPGKRPEKDKYDPRWKEADIPRCECGYDLDVNWRYCPMCGSQLSQ